MIASYRKLWSCRKRTIKSTRKTHASSGGAVRKRTEKRIDRQQRAVRLSNLRISRYESSALYYFATSRGQESPFSARRARGQAPACPAWT